MTPQAAGGWLVVTLEGVCGHLHPPRVSIGAVYSRFRMLTEQATLAVVGDRFRLYQQSFVTTAATTSCSEEHTPSHAPKGREIFKQQR